MLFHRHEKVNYVILTHIGEDITLNKSDQTINQ